MVNLLISIVIAVAISMLAMTLAEAMRRRFGWDPVSSLAGLLSQRDRLGQPLTAAPGVALTGA